MSRVAIAAAYPTQNRRCILLGLVLPHEVADTGQNGPVLDSPLSSTSALDGGTMGSARPFAKEAEAVGIAQSREIGLRSAKIIIAMLLAALASLAYGEYLIGQASVVDGDNVDAVLIIIVSMSIRIIIGMVMIAAAAVDRRHRR